MNDLALLGIVLGYIVVSAAWILLSMATYAGAETTFGQPFGKWIGWFGVAVVTVVAIYATMLLTRVACDVDPGIEQCEE